MSEIEYKIGDRVNVISGQHAGRLGEYVRNCSVVFSDHCRVKLDLKKRERIQKTVMIEKVLIQKING